VLELPCLCLYSKLVIKHLGHYKTGLVNINLPHDPSIPVLGIHPKHKKTYVYPKTYVQIFIAHFYNSPKVQQPKCPVTGEWISTMSYSHTEEQTRSGNKDRSTDMCYSTARMSLKHIVLRKPDAKYHTLCDSLYYMKCPDQASPRDRQ